MISYAHARDLSVYISLEKHGKTYVSVNDPITIRHHSGDILERITKAPITVIDIISKNINPHEEVPRDDMFAENKMKGKGTTEEPNVFMIDAGH